MNRQRLTFINRQPSLWSHSAPVMEIVPADDNSDNTIGLHPLALAPLNADFDGDTVAMYYVHSEEALKEMEEKTFLKNRVHYEQNKEFLASIRHEALFAAYIMTLNLDKINKDDILVSIDRLQDLKEDIDLFNNNLYDTVYLNYTKKYTTYGNALLNKWCGFDHLILNKLIDKKQSNEISRWIYKNKNRDSELFYKQLSKLSKLLFSFISITNYCPSIDISEMIKLVDEDTKELFSKIPDNHVYLGYIINESLVDRCLSTFDKDSILYKLFMSGSRFSKTQLARSVINTGYVSDDKNIIIQKPVKSNLLQGLTEEDFFLGSPGSRKGISDKSIHTPRSGYLERTLVMALSILEIVEDDCGTENHLEIIVFSKTHAKTLDQKYYKDPSKFMEWTILDYRTALTYINKKIWIRSPMTCETPNLRMCKKCFGNRSLPTKYLGINN